MAKMKKVESPGLEQALKEISQNVKNKTLLQVGFLEGATYPDGTPVAMVAAIQEFGAPKAGIPPRPFFRTMVAKNAPRWPAALAGLLKANKYDAKKALSIMGEGIVGQLTKSIIDLRSPPLSPVTVMLRGMKKQVPGLKVTAKTVGIAAKRVADGQTNYGASTKPLIDTAVLLESIDYEVKEG